MTTGLPLFWLLSHTLKTYGLLLISSHINTSCCTNHVQSTIKSNTGTFKHIGFHSRNGYCDSVTQVLIIINRFGTHVFHAASKEKVQWEWTRDWPTSTNPTSRKMCMKQMFHRVVGIVFGWRSRIWRSTHTHLKHKLCSVKSSFRNKQHCHLFPKNKNSNFRRLWRTAAFDERHWFTPYSFPLFHGNILHNTPYVIHLERQSPNKSLQP